MIRTRFAVTRICNGYCTGFLPVDRIGSLAERRAWHEDCDCISLKFIMVGRFGLFTDVDRTRIRRRSTSVISPPDEPLSNRPSPLRTPRRPHRRSTCNPHAHRHESILDFGPSHNLPNGPGVDQQIGVTSAHRPEAHGDRINTASEPIGEHRQNRAFEHKRTTARPPVHSLGPTTTPNRGSRDTRPRPGSKTRHRPQHRTNSQPANHRPTPRPNEPINERVRLRSSSHRPQQDDSKT